MFEKYCNEQGIYGKFTTDTPEQNDAAERKERHLEHGSEYGKPKKDS